MKAKKKTCVLLIAMCLVIGCAIAGTLAWLTAKSDIVTNTFTTSNIDIALDETKTDFKMVPGWTIEKDPKVTVKAGSEDCWLFVEVTESTDPELAKYIAYQVDLANASIGKDGWTQGNGSDIPTNVYYRQVKDVIKDSEYVVLGAGTQVVSGVEYTWTNNQVLVLPTVTKDMMDSLDKNQQYPTLTFQAYAVQLWKTNKPDSNATNEQIAAAQFTAKQAWGQAEALKTTKQ